MSECIDSRLGNQLYAYELGLLSEQETAAFEQHLIACPYCAQRAADFVRVSSTIRDDQDIHDLTRTLAEQETERSPEAEAGEERRPWFRRPWSLSLPLAAAAVLILLLVDWQVIIKPADEVVATENRLVIVPFANLENADDPEHLGDIATNLLVTSLGESKALHVMSVEHLLALDKDSTFDRNASDRLAVALTLARRGKGRWMLSGEILQTEPHLVITSRLTDVTTGDVLGTQRVDGAPGGDIFALTDKLSAEIGMDLPLGTPDSKGISRPVAEITTHSLEAYRHYLAGVECKTRVSNAKAIEEFQLALRYDSTLAMAYYHLAQMTDRELINRAMAFRSGVSRRERHYIECTFAMMHGDTATAVGSMEQLIGEYPLEANAYYRLGVIYERSGKAELAIAALENAIRIDPSLRGAYNLLAYAYDMAGKRDQSILAISRYIEVAPGEPNPYDTRGDLYEFHGQIDDAIASYAKALSIDPDFTLSLDKLGRQYLVKLDFERAESCFTALSLKSGSADRAAGRRALAVSSLLQGKFSAALLRFDTAISADTVDSQFESAVENLLLKSRLLAELNRFREAAHTTTGCLRLIEAHSLCCDYLHRAFLVGFVAKQQDTAETRRQLDVLHALSVGNDTALAFDQYARGCLDFDKEDYRSALGAFEEASRRFVHPDFSYMLGRTYLETGELGRAARQFEELLAGVQPTSDPLLTTNLHYYLGRTYEESRWFDKAIEQYETYLSYWQNADVTLRTIQDAQRRLKALKQS